MLWATYNSKFANNLSYKFKKKLILTVNKLLTVIIVKRCVSDWNTVKHAYYKEPEMGNFDSL